MARADRGAQDGTDEAQVRARMMSMGGLVGGAITFVAVGIIDDLLKIALGAAVGAGVGLLFWAQSARANKDRRAQDLKSLTKADLLKLADNLGIEGRTSLNKDELIEVVAQRTSVGDDTGAKVVDLVEETEARLGAVKTRARQKARNHRRRQAGC